MKYKITNLFKEYKITGINFDSRKIKNGEAFFALRGSTFDGNEYINDALKAGAPLIFSDGEFYNNNKKADVIYVEDVRAALNIATEIIYPNLPKNLIAVTGTSGKTSVVSYCQQLFALLGAKSASLGTIGLVCSEQAIRDKFNTEQYKALTSPDILTFRQILNYLAKHNINNLAFEASSHGIEQKRLGNIAVQAAAFTNFSQDHLDYHDTMDKYLAAKLKLFTGNLSKDGLAVICSDIPDVNRIKDFLSENNIKFLTVGATGDVKICTTRQSINGQEIVFSYQGKEYVFNTEIIGSFQACNLLIAARLVNQFGFSMEKIVKQLPFVKAVKGRLDRITTLDSPFHIFVDYSHKPESLEKALVELKEIKKVPGSRLIVVFGCGGDRDIGKRQLMGKISGTYADIVIITDDNPRFENAAEIRKQILAAVPVAEEIGDRTSAIISAVKRLKAGDILLIAGKGHEDYQIIGDKKIPLDDFKIAESALENRLL